MKELFNIINKLDVAERYKVGDIIVEVDPSNYTQGVYYLSLNGHVILSFERTSTDVVWESWVVEYAKVDVYTRFITLEVAKHLELLDDSDDVHLKISEIGL